MKTRRRGFSCFKRQVDRRPSWVRRKSLALRSGNVYAIESVREEEEIIKYYELLRQLLVRRILEEKSTFQNRGEEPKDEVTKVIKLKKGIAPILAKLKEEPEVPDYGIIEDILPPKK